MKARTVMIEIECETSLPVSILRRKDIYIGPYQLNVVETPKVNVIRQTKKGKGK